MESYPLYLENWETGTPFYAIYTNHQTEGKGLADNRWLSEPLKNLAFSALFRPPLPAQKQFIFNQYFAVAIRDLLAQYLPNPLIKWPNDIYVNEKKIAGILIHHLIQGEEIKATIAGVGININQIDFDPTLPNPISMALITNQLYDVNQIAHELAEKLDELYGLIINQEWDTIEKQYFQYFYRYLSLGNYKIGGQEMRGTIVGLSPYGQLLVQGEGGTLFTCNYKEVVFLPPHSTTEA